MSETVLSAVIGAAVTAGVALVGFLFSRRRAKLEIKKLELEVSHLQKPLPQSTSAPDRMQKLREGLQTITRQLHARNYRPDAIVAFNRSGAILAGMLAVSLKIDHVLVVPRARSTGTTSDSTSTKLYNVGELITLNKEKLNSMKILVVFMLVETVNTLNDGKAFLKSQGVLSQTELAAMYIASGAENLLPDAIFAYTTQDPRGVLDELPWVTDGWDFV